MNTWTCKASICLLVSLGVSACETLPIPKLAFATVLPGKQHQGRVYRTAEMLNGRFVLVPPENYCIDGDSLTQTFALMADCAVLVDDSDANPDEPDILTATFSTTKDMSKPSVQTVSASLAPLSVRNGFFEDDVAFVQVTDPNLRPELDPVHWRGVLQHQGTIVGFATYAAKGLDASPKLIKQAAQNLSESNTSVKDNQTAGRALNFNLKSIVGLFQ